MRVLLSFAAFALAASGCEALGLAPEERKDDRPFDVTLRVESDPGHGLKDAELLLDGKTIGKTDGKGLAIMSFSGKEGDALELAVKCPPGYDAPTQPLRFSLRRIGVGAKGPTYDAKCPPKVRTVVVGVRTENGPNVPVEYLGRQMAKTDAAGAAHFALSVRPGEQVEITLSTTKDKALEALRPQNPTLTFVTKAYDDFVVLEQKFQIERKPVAGPPRRPAPARPMPL